MKYFVALFFLITFSAQAKEHFVCESEALKTFEDGMAVYNSMPPGDSVLFCRGGVFPVTKLDRILKRECRPDQPWTIGAYGEGDRPKFLRDGGMFNIATRCSDGASGYVFKDLDIQGSGTGTAGFFLYGGISDVVLDNVRIDSFERGISVNANKDQHPSENVTIQNSQITNNSRNGLYGGANNFIIKNNEFDNNGFNHLVMGHNIYLGGHGLKGMLVEDNILTKSAYGDRGCTSVSLVIHGLIDDITIQRNTIEDQIAIPQCYGIAIGAGYNEEEHFTNVKILNNTILNTGAVGIYLDAVTGGEIIGNNIHQDNNTYFDGIKISLEHRVKPDGVPIHLTSDIKVTHNRINFAPGDYTKSGVTIIGDIPGLEEFDNIF